MPVLSNLELARSLAAWPSLAYRRGAQQFTAMDVHENVNRRTALRVGEMGAVYANVSMFRGGASLRAPSAQSSTIASANH